MGAPHGGVVSVRIIMMRQVTYIGVGLSALLGWTIRAMREPQHRGPGSRTGSTFFRVYVEEPRTKNICRGSRAEHFNVMKKFFFCLLVALPMFASAQVLKERRIYYLDCSYSMALGKLWTPVCDNLKKAIDAVPYEDTELLVIPFAFDNKNHPRLSGVSANADQAGKAKLKAYIDGLVLNKKTMTYHRDVLDDFYNRNIDDGKVTYIFLMTDGQDEGLPKEKFPSLLSEWGKRYGDKNVYGFYVMLDAAARNVDVEKMIESQPHLWKVETADININLIRLQHHAIFNIRNDSYIDLPIYGTTDGLTINACFDPSSPYEVTKVEQDAYKLRAFINVKENKSTLPDSASHRLNLTMSGGGEFDFLVTETVDVKCENKKERSLKIAVQP